MGVTEPLLRSGAAPIVIGHRGASAIRPENSLAAFDAAWEGGTPWVETDVQPTSDDVLVLIHDETVDRTTNGSGAVRGLSGDEVAGLDAGAWFGRDYVGTAVPTLVELLARLRGDRRLLLEIKGDHTSRQLEQILTRIADAEASTRVFLQSFEVEVLERLRALRPDEPIGLLVEEIGDDPVADCRRIGATAYNPDFLALLERPEVVDELHRAGIATLPWFVNDPEHWSALTDLGVDGIITDRPGDLVTWQRERAAR